MKKNFWRMVTVVLMVLVLGACAKKVTPPEVETATTDTSGASKSQPAESGFGTSRGAEGFPSPGLSAEEKAMQDARMLPFRATTDLKDIHFKYDKYDLDDDSKKSLQKNADWLKEHPGIKVEIQGHCDERGTNNYNLGLGDRRANATKQYLTALGVDAARLFTISYGEEKPFCTESNESCWWQNRRSHFMISGTP